MNYELHGIHREHVRQGKVRISGRSHKALSTPMSDRRLCTAPRAMSTSHSNPRMRRHDFALYAVDVACFPNTCSGQRRVVIFARRYLGHGLALGLRVSSK